MTIGSIRVRHPNRQSSGTAAINGNARCPEVRSRKVCACGGHGESSHRRDRKRRHLRARLAERRLWGAFL